MDQTVLISAPEEGSLNQTLRRLHGKSFSWVYLGQDIKQRRQAERAFSGCGSQIDASSRFHEATQVLRDPFLDYVFAIAQAVDSLLWWLSSVSYRRGEVSKTFHQACYLKMALDLVKATGFRGPLVLVAATVSFRRTIHLNLAANTGIQVTTVGSARPLPFQRAQDLAKLVVRRSFFLARETRRLMLAKRIIRRHVPTEPTTLVISTVSRRTLRDGAEFPSFFFGNLAEELGDLGIRVTPLALILREVPFKAALQGLRGGLRPVMVLNRYLKFFDLVYVAVATIRPPPVPRPLPDFVGMDIAPLLNEDLRVHWVSNRAAEAMLLVALARRLSRLTSSITRIIYVYENQPWERALCWGARRYLPDVTLVGYQHSRVPRLLLNFPLAQGEATTAPLPHRIVTVGKHWAELMSSDGYGPNRVRVGGAIQAQNLLELGEKAGQPTEPEGAHTVLIACPNALEEAADLVDTAARIFDEDAGIRVVVKCHPITPFDWISPLLDGPLPNHVRVSEEPIQDLMLKSSVMVYTGSTVCVQALALGLPVVHLKPRFDLDQDPFETVPDVRLEATGAEQLREKLLWLLDHRQEYIAQRRDMWRSVVRNMYGPVTEKTYRAFIE